MPVIGIGNNTTFQNNPFGTPDNIYTGIESLKIGELAPDFNFSGETQLALGLATGDRFNSMIRATALSNIPSNATITEARVYVYGQGGFGSITASAHGLLRNWTVAQATWNSYITGSSWTTPGAKGDATDRQTTADDSIAVTGGWMAIDVTQITQDIVDGTITDNGVLLDALGAADGGFRFLGDAVNGTDGERAEWVVNYTVPSGITGTISETEENDSLSATGTVGSVINGTVSYTEANDTLSASGSLIVSGSLSETEGNDTLSSSGLVWNAIAFGGTPPDPETTESFYELAINDLGFTADTGDILHYTPATGLTVDTQWIPVVDPAADVSGFYYIYDVSADTYTSIEPYTIDQRISGEVDYTEAGDTLSASGTLTVSGSISETEESDSLSASGTVGSGIIGTISETEANDTLSASGTILVSGSLSETEENDVLSSSGTVGTVNITGSLNETEENDTLSASGLVIQNITGSISETEANDTLSASGVLTVSGSLSETEGNDVLSSSGLLIVSGSLSETEASDTASISGSLIIVGTFSETEANDTLSASGLIIQDIDGSISETEGNDTLVATGVIGTESLVEYVVEQMILWLPENNVLTEAQMTVIAQQLFDELGPDAIPEILCKALERAALLNKSKASTYYALSRERNYQVEFYFNTGGKTPADLWDDYIASLKDICPIFGYSPPSSIGIVVNAGVKPKAVKYCRPCDNSSSDFLY